MLIEIHMLKNYPVTNLNRDDTGAPKTCYFGGSQRGRISSQCLKRTWRTSEQFQALESAGYRSRTLPEMIAKRLADAGVAADMVAVAQKMLTGIANKDGKTNDKKITSQIIFFSPDDVTALTDCLLQLIDQAGESKKLEKNKPDEINLLMKKANARAITLDIALFGRMVTSDAFVNVDAAMQVAHAVSTHTVNLESDYYTAVDDLLGGSGGADEAEGEQTGAGMIGDIDYNSCCYYLYAALDTDVLRENLKNSPDAQAKLPELLPTLLTAMAQSNPTGKQNTFAGHVLPEMVMVEFKQRKVPLSYANAFAEPVSLRKGHVVRESIEKLAKEVDLMDGAYALSVTHRAWMALRGDQKPTICDTFRSMKDMVQACANWAKE